MEKPPILPAFTARARMTSPSGLQITKLAFPPPPGEFDDVGYAKVFVFSARIRGSYGKTQGIKCELKWTHVGAETYQVWRSERGPNVGFELIGTTPQPIPYILIIMCS